MKSTNMVIITCNSNKSLLESVANSLGQKRQIVSLSKFKDGEICLKFTEDVALKNVLILTSLGRPINDNIMELLFSISALKRSGANKVFVYCSYFSYARQDRPVNEYKAVSGSDLVNFIQSAGADGLFYTDIHVEQLSGFGSFNLWKDHLRCESLYANHLVKTLKDVSKLCVVCPDVGALKRAKTLAKEIGKVSSKEHEVRIINKERLSPNEVSGLQLIGEVKDRDCVLIDDMVDTGGTIFKACDLLKEKGANNVYVVITHGICSEGFYEKLKDSKVDRFFLTNSLEPSNPEKEKGSKVERIDLSNHIAEFLKDRLKI